MKIYEKIYFDVINLILIPRSQNVQKLDIFLSIILNEFGFKLGDYTIWKHGKNYIIATDYKIFELCEINSTKLQMLLMQFTTSERLVTSKLFEPYLKFTNITSPKFIDLESGVQNNFKYDSNFGNFGIVGYDCSNEFVGVLKFCETFEQAQTTLEYMQKFEAFEDLEIVDIEKIFSTTYKVCQCIYTDFEDFEFDETNLKTLKTFDNLMAAKNFIISQKIQKSAIIKMFVDNKILELFFKVYDSGMILYTSTFAQEFSEQFAIL
jgi:hypothetical protein